ncbi:hypothetical protein [Micromonospora sp. AMSO31t]|uniref:hypothetical protein n=1 Tax=Micromonospora sp. AMSO31t TaxID=2650566 RepID=UPI00351BE9EE
MTVSARGRGAAARPKEIKVWLPGDELTRVIPRSTGAGAVRAAAPRRFRVVGPAAAAVRPLTVVGSA